MEMQPDKKLSAQVSLEYLIVLAAFFSVLLLFAPLISSIYFNSVFSLDLKQAKSFSLEFKNALKELSVLENGSVKSISFNPLNEWSIKAEGKLLQVEIESKDLKKKKTIETELLQEIVFENNFSSQTTIKLIKAESGEILIEYS